MLNKKGELLKACKECIKRHEENHKKDKNYPKEPDCFWCMPKEEN